MTYFIDLRADNAGGNPVASIRDIYIRTDVEPNPSSPEALAPELFAAIQGRDVLLGTHGFNVNRPDGIQNLSHWSQWLTLGPNGQFVGVLWPGDSSGIHGIDYPVEGSEAIRSGGLLAEYLTTCFTGASSLSFASHSLGARMVLETIRQLRGALRLNSLTLLAGAIDDTCLDGEYKDAALQMCRISVLASRRDDVLKWAFPVGNFFAGIITRKDPYWHAALGREGPNPSNQPPKLCQTPILPDAWDFGHHSYINYQSPDLPPTVPFPLPQVVPPETTPPPSTAANWQQSWAGAFASTRFPCSS